jgi:tetratricopeptide (TPR) repeat protein
MTGEKYLELGFVYLEEKMWSQAAECLARAEKTLEREKHKIPALLNSYLGLAIAMSGGDLNEAVRRARRALDKASYRPDFYLNLGRIYLKAKDKEKAVQTFRLGLRLDDRHPGLTKELKKLGIRGAPVLKFLPRTNFLNKYLGRIRRLRVSKR